MITIKKFEFNMLPVNTYIVWDETKEAVVIDAGCYFESEKQALKAYVANNGLTIKHLLCTHLHFDHIFGNPFMLSEFGVRGEAHKADLPWLEQMPERIKLFGVMDYDPPVALKGFIDEGDTIGFGTHAFSIFHIPGHSAGSLAFYCAEEHALFTGDTLFCGCIGRTDLDGSGSEQQLIEAIQQKLLTLPEETVIYPGHGSATTIGREKKQNIYLR